MRVLLTAGGTEEPIDSVRRITNTSSGATGAALAAHFAERGAEVVLLHADRAAAGMPDVERLSFVSFAELEAALRRLLGERRFDAVVHLAAVSDYAVGSVEVDGRPWGAGPRGKIASGREVVIRLRPNPKLIDSLRAWSCNPEVVIIGFKLTDEPDAAAREAAARAQLDRGAADLVVHNDVREIDGARHAATIHGRRGARVRTETKQQLAAELYRLLADGGLR